MSTWRSACSLGLLMVLAGCGGEAPAERTSAAPPSSIDPAAVEPLPSDGPTPQGAEAATEEQAPVEVDVDQLLMEAAADAEAFATRYHQKAVQIRGVATQAGEEFPGQTYIALGAKGSLTGVICRFADDPQPWATAVPRQEVTLRGTCHVLAGEPVLESCEFVSVGSAPATVPAEQLAASFAADREGAWDRHREQTLIVQGTVRGVESRGSASVLVLAGTADANIDCWFNSRNKGQVADVQVGDEVKIAGELIASPDEEVHFPLSQCLLITRPPAVTPRAEAD